MKNTILKISVSFFFIISGCLWNTPFAQTLIHEDEFINRRFNDFKFGGGWYWFTGKTFGNREVAAFRLFDEETHQEILEIESGRPTGNHHGGPARYYHSFGNSLLDTATGRFFLYRSSQQWENHYSILLTFDTNGNELNGSQYDLSPTFVRGDTLYAYNFWRRRYHLLQTSNIDFELGYPLQTTNRFTSLGNYSFLTAGSLLFSRNGEMYRFETEDFLDVAQGYQNEDIIRTLSDTTFMYLAQKVRFDSASSKHQVTKMVMRIFDIEMNKLYEAESDYNPGVIHRLSHIQPAPDSGFWAFNAQDTHIIRFDRSLKLRNRLFFDAGYQFRNMRVREGNLHLLTYRPHQTNYRIYRDHYYIVEDDTATSTGSKFQNNKVTLFPNPTHGDLRISGFSDNGEVSVYNLTGALVKQGRLPKEGTFSIQELPSGIYIFTVRTETTNQKFKVIKK